MRTYRNYHDRPVRENYRTKMYEGVGYEDGVPEVLTQEWVRANIPADAAHVDIPYGVKILGTACFYGCTSLKSITIPDSVESIGWDCFRDCESLTSITIPESVASMGWNCFESCCSLESITIPSSVRSIAGWCFSHCESLKSITILGGVSSIGVGCFWDCASLKTIAIPSSVTSVEWYCFDGCSSLTDVYYGGSKESADGIKFGGGNDSVLHATWHYNSRGVNEGFYSNHRRNTYRGRRYLRESNDLDGIYADLRDIAETQLKDFAEDEGETVKEYLESEYYDAYFDRIMDYVDDWLTGWSDDGLIEEVGKGLDHYLSIARQADGVELDEFADFDYETGEETILYPEDLYYNKWNDTNITPRIARDILTAVASDTVERYLYRLAKSYNIKLKIY